MYEPVTLVDKLYNYPMQNDSRFILSELSKKEKIQKLYNDSISWYNNLPNNIDLMITHVPPFRNKRIVEVIILVTIQKLKNINLQYEYMVMIIKKKI